MCVCVQIFPIDGTDNDRYEFYGDLINVHYCIGNEHFMMQHKYNLHKPNERPTDRPYERTDGGEHALIQNILHIGKALNA